MKVEVLSSTKFEIDWQKADFTCEECRKCPFYDDSSGFDWCVWLRRRCLSHGKPPECRVCKVQVEEKRNERGE